MTQTAKISTVGPSLLSHCTGHRGTAGLGLEIQQLPLRAANKPKNRIVTDEDVEKFIPSKKKRKITFNWHCQRHSRTRARNTAASTKPKDGIVTEEDVK